LSRAKTKQKTKQTNKKKKRISRTKRKRNSKTQIKAHEKERHARKKARGERKEIITMLGKKEDQCEIRFSQTLHLT
jgi:hypothetical protein